MLILEARQTCPHQVTCPYNTTKYGGNFVCQGMNSERDTSFTCNKVNPNGTFIKDGQMSNPLDKTGKMKIIME